MLLCDMDAFRRAGMAAIAIGLGFSHSLISIGVGTLLAGILFHAAHRRNLFQTASQWRWLYLPFLLLYGLHGVSWFYTENADQWLVEMRVKLPFVFLLPVAIVGWAAASQREKALIMTGYHSILLAVGFGTLARLLLNLSWALEEIRHGRYIPMLGGISHIYYSALVGMGLFFLWKLPLLGGKAIRWIIAAGYLVILHGLSLRTGLVAIYATAIGVLTLWALQMPQRVIWVLLATLFMALTLTWMVRCFPPMKRRWWSLQEDLATYKPNGYITHSSVARRLASLEASWIVFQKNPWFGVSMADNMNAIAEEIPKLPYRWDKETYILPHNQFIEYAIGLGIIGLGIFMVFWGAALRQKLGLLWGGWLLYWFILFQIEAFLERQIGVTAFLWGTGLWWAELRQAKS